MFNLFLILKVVLYNYIAKQKQFPICPKLLFIHLFKTIQMHLHNCAFLLYKFDKNKYVYKIYIQYQIDFIHFQFKI